jgi:hypothetical protein
VNPLRGKPRRLRRYCAEQGLVSQQSIKALAHTVREQQNCRSKIKIETYAWSGAS